MGIPLSAERIKRTERATEAVKRRESKTAQMVPFSQVFYVDEEGKAHALDEWSEEICGHLLDLDGNVRGMMKDLASTMKKVEELESKFEERVFHALNIEYLKCGGKVAFYVMCLECKRDLLMQPLKYSLKKSGIAEKEAGLLLLEVTKAHGIACSDGSRRPQ